MPKRRNTPREWSPTTLTDDNNGHGRLQSPWQYIISNAAPYPIELFAQITLQLILHPERNSKNIRRADILSDTDENLNLPKDETPVIQGMINSRTIRRRLMPRNPNLDPELEQTCRLYAVEGESHHTLVTYYCHYIESVGVPYYFPDVLGVAFEFYEGNVYIAYLPLPDKSCLSDRLERVALNLLMTIHRHCLGTYEGYKKRVYHDVLVDKSAYQDLYISLKNKYAKSLIENWAEETDPLKHVFEDISLATFLILLWDQSNGKKTKFVDIGCGNGYKGQGFDARSRKSWNIFPQHIQHHLSEKIIIPHFLEDVPCKTVHNGIFEDGTFLISNHADELTPYTPLLAGLTPGSGFLAIPCCEHDFSGAKAPGGLLRPSKEKSKDGDVGQGRYGMYCEWISEIAKEMRWVVEREMLRIPSTRNVGIVGRYLESHGNKELALDVINKFGGPNGFQGFIERAKGLKEKIHRGH